MFTRKYIQAGALTLAIAVGALLCPFASASDPSGTPPQSSVTSVQNRDGEQTTTPTVQNANTKQSLPQPPAYVAAPNEEAAQPFAPNAGDAEVAFQGYYLGSSGEPLLDTSGLSVDFHEFIGGVGLLSGTLQGYGTQGKFRTGNESLDLQKVKFWGQHWRFTGGDFTAPANLVSNPFTNIYNPEIAARGFRMEISRDNRTFGFFVGGDTLQEGPRVAFRVSEPQAVIGTYVRQQVGDNFQVAVRYLHFASSEQDIEANTFLFPVGRQFTSADTLTVQSSYSLSKQFKLYGESAISGARGPDSAKTGGPASFFFGPAWESPRFTLRANYAYQTSSYFPVIGYFSGDRRGPFAEARYQLTKRLELNASASHYANNVANDPAVSSFRTSAYSAGTSLNLPWKFSANATVSWIDLLASTPSTGLRQNSQDQQLLLSVNRPLGRHNIRFAYTGLRLDSDVSRQKQRSFELSDNFAWKYLVLGGAVRTQKALATDTRDTLFFRGSAQVNVRRLSAYAYVEKGTDLLNKTLFATNTYSTTVIGATIPLVFGWNLQAEAFRNQLNTDLNPESIFVLQSQGVPVTNTLSAFNQWSTYVRIVKRFRWGGSVPAGGWDNYAAIHNPLVGVIEGVVEEQELSGNRPVAGIPVSLDGGRVASTGPDGHYRFSDVPEGYHDVVLAMQELPADFDSGAAVGAKVKVDPRAVSRANMAVSRLTQVAGKISVPAGVSAEDIVVRLAPTSRYTTPDNDGTFSFYNLREGDYELVLDEGTVPEDCQVVSGKRIPVAVRLDAALPPIEFKLEMKKAEKPVHIMIQQNIEVGSTSPQKDHEAPQRRPTANAK